MGTVNFHCSIHTVHEPVLSILHKNNPNNKADISLHPLTKLNYLTELILTGCPCSFYPFLHHFAVFVFIIYHDIIRF